MINGRFGNQFVLTPSPKIWPGTSWNRTWNQVPWCSMGPSMSQLYHRIDDFTAPTAGSIFKRFGLFPQVKARGKWATMHHYALCVYPKHLQCDNDNSYGPLCSILMEGWGSTRAKEREIHHYSQLFGPENPSEFPLVMSRCIKFLEFGPLKLSLRELQTAGPFVSADGRTLRTHWRFGGARRCGCNYQGVPRGGKFSLATVGLNSGIQRTTWHLPSGYVKIAIENGHL